MKKVYALTDGLIGSMMLRYDHGIFMGMASSPVWMTRPSVKDTRDEIIAMYHRLNNFPPTENSDVSDRQVYQEMTGEGFYHPDREQDYANSVTRALADEEDWETGGGRERAIAANEEWERSRREWDEKAIAERTRL